MKRHVVLALPFGLCLASLQSEVVAQQGPTTRESCTPVAEAVEQRDEQRRAGTLVGTPAAGYTGMTYGGEFVFENGAVAVAGELRVTEVICDSPADRAGVRTGDVLLTVNGRDAREPGALAPRRAGLRFDLRIRRGEQTLTLSFVSVARGSSGGATR